MKRSLRVFTNAAYFAAMVAASFTIVSCGSGGGNAPVTQVPVNTPPVVKPPVNTPPVNTPPVNKPPVNTPPVNTPPVNTPPVIDPYYHAWYDVYGNVCGGGANMYPGSGCNFYLDGVGKLYKITDGQDPFYSSSYSLGYNTWTYYDSYGYSQVYTGYGWESASGILYDDLGYALNESEQVKSRDHARVGASKEKMKVQEAAASFKDAHPALSESGATRIAINLGAWATLTKDRTIKRGRTESDIADFSQRLFGVDYKKAQAALVKASMGERTDLLNLKDDVGAAWGDSSPNREETQDILMKWYKNEVGSAK